MLVGCFVEMKAQDVLAWSNYVKRQDKDNMKVHGVESVFQPLSPLTD